ALEFGNRSVGLRAPGLHLSIPETGRTSSRSAPATPVPVMIQGEMVSFFVERDTIVFSKDRIVLPRGFRLSLFSSRAVADQPKQVTQVTGAGALAAVPVTPVPKVEAPPPQAAVFRTDRSAV